MQTTSEECIRNLFRESLNIINRQQDEIEGLKAELIKQQLKNNLLYEATKENTAEAIKEFAERLKGYAFDIYTRDEYIKLVAVHRIDNLVKEMVSDME